MPTNVSPVSSVGSLSAHIARITTQTAHALALTQKTKVSLIGPRNGTISTQKPKTSTDLPKRIGVFYYCVHLYSRNP